MLFRSSAKKKGQLIDVEVPTHVAGILDFAGGAVGMLLTSFDVWSAELPRIEIYGSLGTLSVPDPNGFGGPVRIRPADRDAFSEVPISRSYADNSRGLGVADMARALAAGRNDHRASGGLALHVLETMHGILEASASGKHYQMQSTTVIPEAVEPDRQY